MGDATLERWGAASGFVVVAVGAAATVFERGTISVDDPVAKITAYFANNRSALLAQSLLFVLGAAIFVWFVGALRSYLARAEGAAGMLSSVAFGAGIAWVGISLAAQAFQIGLAISSKHEVVPAPVGIMWALFTVAAIPIAVMLAATAVASFRYKAFPAWLGWLALTAAAGYLLVLLGIVVESGPLSPTGWITYAAYPLYVVWLLCATTVMVRRPGRPSESSTVAKTRPRGLPTTPSAA